MGYEFEIRKASDWEYCEHYLISSLEDLERLQKANNDNDLVIDFFERKIIIYDDYLE